MVSRICSSPEKLARIGCNDVARQSELIRLQVVLKEAFEFSASAMGSEDAAGLHRVLGELVEKLRGMAPGAVVMVPGGWRGQQSVGWVMHIIERSADGQSFALTTANAGQGIEYHLAKPGHDKTKYRTCLRLDGLPGERLLDPGFWAVALSLWVRGEASEFSRVEVLYDVLLPWLANGPLLPTAAGVSQSPSSIASLPDGVEWRSAARSGAAGAWKCSVEALRCQLLRAGDGSLFTRRCSRGHWKTSLSCHA